MSQKYTSLSDAINDIFEYYFEKSKRADHVWALFNEETPYSINARWETVNTIRWTYLQKIERAVDSIEDVFDTDKDDIEKLDKETRERWAMLFNVRKCVAYIRHGLLALNTTINED